MKFLKRLLKQPKKPQHAWLLDPEDQGGISILPQVARSARLVIDPLRDATNASSYVGGDPHLPDNVAWPESEGTPMGFVMQLDCTELPEDLWGGLGPRRGFLSVFVQGNWTFVDTPLRVIYHEARGQLRPTPDMPMPAWRSDGVRGPKVAFHVEARTTTSSDSFDMAEPPAVCFERSEDMMPLTWGQAVHLLDNLSKYIGRIRLRAAPSTAEKLDMPSRPGENYHLLGLQKTRKVDRLAVALVLRLLRMAMRKPTDACLSDEERAEMARALAQISVPKGENIDLRPGQSILGQRIVYNEVKDPDPETLGDLRQIYSKSALAWEKASRDSARSKRNVESMLNWCQEASAFIPSKDVPDYDRGQLNRAIERLRSDIAAIEAFQEETNDRIIWFEAMRKGFDTNIDGGFGIHDTRPVPTEMSETLDALRIAARPELEHYQITDALYPIWTPDCSERAVLALTSRQLADWSRLWHRTAVQLALRDPDLVPNMIRTQFMNWLRDKLACAPHEMGGLPGGRYYYEKRWFDPMHYLPEHQRHSWLTDGEQTDWGCDKSHTACDPPFDGENVLLLHLSYDAMLDWRWGDGCTILFAMPRDALENGNWEQVEAQVTN